MERKHRAPVVTGLFGRRIAVFLAATALFGAAAACGAAEPDDAPRLRAEVVATRPHDPALFTQGLEIHDGVLYESTGLPGESLVRTSDLATGAEHARADLPAPLFGEGITRAGDVLWQLTYTEGVAIARDAQTLTELRRTDYEGEGWGLCTRGDRIVMSNGTATLTFRDPETFAPVGEVTLASRGDTRLNELDCAPDGSVYANAWPTDTILRIDPETGTVLAVIDASGLLPRSARTPSSDVLNGIAHIPGTDRFLLTGKKWPSSFEVRFVPE
ncbi:glutaminyl-peptide cyclotransferase [Nocardia otitidiscaviarum]|uniref:glutaminyl-peptide cyclotransferase n=1 Tax=Nocardia otitidiscaviarum TaxID=1823 RepID=UPI0018956040|nr:glutaminyl-peptide cyclotransferase [Nocardia otitidiscaviarum]MBF6179413.1 glutaminyl-peptide cyclotransferase [Nocardia otitidiscaviarum]